MKLKIKESFKFENIPNIDIFSLKFVAIILYTKIIDSSYILETFIELIYRTHSQEMPFEIKDACFLA